jgi:hypothetical protein
MEENERAYTNEEIFKAITRLPEEEQQIILTTLGVDNIKAACASKTNIEACNQALHEKADITIKISNALTQVYENVNNPITASCDDIMRDYDKLKKENKKMLALTLLNNNTFQKDCCEIMIADLKREIAEDQSLKAVDSMFNISGFLEKCLCNGIGLNHTYTGNINEKHI